MRKKISIFSFFSGIGILDLAFEKNGYIIVFVNEYDNLFMESYQYAREQMNRHTPIYGYHNDSAERYAKRRGKRNLINLVAREHEKGNLVGFIGGPPCPDFSVAGKNAGANGENGRLTKVYTDFSADTQLLFSADIEQASSECAIVCIIDNYLSGANRAKEVIKVISDKSKDIRRNIVGSIFSSKEMYEEISDALYFEYAPKDKSEQLKSCIARSAYNYFISELKSETLLALEKRLTPNVKYFKSNIKVANT